MKKLVFIFLSKEKYFKHNFSLTQARKGKKIFLIYSSIIFIIESATLPRFEDTNKVNQTWLHFLKPQKPCLLNDRQKYLETIRENLTYSNRILL